MTTTTTHAESLAEAHAALDKLGPITPGDLIRPFVEWLDDMHTVWMTVVDVVAGPQEWDADLHARAVALSRVLDRAGDLASMYMASHIAGPSDAAGLAARTVFEAVTRSQDFRRDVVVGEEYYTLVAETAK